MPARMRSRPGRPVKASRRSGRWAGQITGRPAESDTGLTLIIVLVLVVLVGAAVAFFGWMMDRQLHRGILQQRAEAATRADWVPLASLPPHVPHAFLTAVDPVFLERSSPELEARETLTRDLLRQVHQLGGDLRGNARELSMGMLLDYRLSRAEVLELYLNRVYLGEHEGWPVFGLYHAAREYFDKGPRELTTGEAATLAGLLLPPRLDEPARWPGALGARRNEVLRQMLAAGLITPEDFAAAAREPLQLRHAAAFTPMTMPVGAQREAQIIRVAPPPADTLQAR
ncbi:hypothetical protein BH24GEM3_BH24GEM3_24340 [soil metagenome]